IYFNYSENGYYKLTLGRGSNTKSLKLYLYKKVGTDEEVLLASDESSLKNNIYQNSGEDNPYFYVNISKNNGNINVEFRLENDNKKLALLTATDNSNLTGTIGYEAIGSSNVVLIDGYSVECYDTNRNENIIKLYLLGDSTAKNYGDDNTIGGWGEYLVNYLDNGVEIINKAEGGRSARSYLNQGRLKEVTDILTPDDYVFVQFGTNDQRTDDSAFMEHAVVLGEPDENGIYPTNPAIKSKTPQWIYDFYKDSEYPYGETFYPYESGTFKWYMKQHIDSIKATGATPVLLTPMCRMFFDKDGKITPHFGENDGYITAIRQLANEEGIMCLDMYEITKSLYESYGILTTQGLHNIKSNGEIDLTHYNKFGANLIASKMAEDIKENTSLPISSHVINSTVTVEKTTDLKTANLFVVGGSFAKGDSISDYAVDNGGFGDYLQKYLNSKITVTNLGVANSTAKTYANTNEYKTLLNSVKEGDYVILSFGNDDSKKVGDSFATGSYEDRGSFAYYMYNNYIKPLKEKNVIIVMLTPFSDRNFVNGEYVIKDYEQTQAITKLVVDNGTFIVNTHNVMNEIYKTMGEEGSKVINAVSREYGLLNTLSEFGADLVAKKILTNLKQSSISLKDYVLDDKLSENNKMTRADFVVMAMDAANIKGTLEDNFDDVTAGKYYTEKLGIAKSLGLITAKDNNNFYPELPLTDDFVKSLTQNIFKFLAYNGKLDDVYNLCKGEISPEIGIWAIDRLYEELNK
ncbi:MAG: GDSL-type esterase/lipase family protein, partial [Lachnospirales bacterium]